MGKNIFLFILFTAFSTMSFSQSHRIKIPSDYSSIQSGINKALNGDTVLVSPGTYFENINFRGKKIVVASNYIVDNDVNSIKTTIIDGSQKPEYADTASCVIFSSGEDSMAVLEGFTITNGKGTRTYYPFDKQYFLQGGGIDIIKSSPTIRNNIIMNNGSLTGMLNGGGIGINYNSNPKIINNLIQFNKGSFGVGISLWEHSHAKIKNNIICFNNGGYIYGGAGIATDSAVSIIENNTIVYNISIGLYGGGICVWYAATKATPKILNNIIWGNKQASGGPIASISGEKAKLLYCDIEAGYEGTGNINQDPKFVMPDFLLSANSPCIDAGDANSKYNDPENIANSGFASLPCMGSLRNDIGAYGGPNSSVISDFNFSRLGIPKTNISFGTKNIVGNTVIRNISILNQSFVDTKIDSVVVKNSKKSIRITHFPANLNPLQNDSIQIEWTPLEVSQINDSILIYHRALDKVNPQKVYVSGKASFRTSVDGKNNEEYIKNYPNPFKEVTTINYSTPGNSASLIIYDICGQIIKKYEGLYGSGSIQFDGSDLGNGVYFNKLIASDKRELTNKMIILK